MIRDDMIRELMDSESWGDKPTNDTGKEKAPEKNKAASLGAVNHAFESALPLRQQKLSAMNHDPMSARDFLNPVLRMDAASTSNKKSKALHLIE